MEFIKRCTGSVSTYMYIVFISHKLRNTFLQLTLISLDFNSWKLHHYLCQMNGSVNIHKVDTVVSNPELHGYEINAKSHYHGHHTGALVAAIYLK